MTDVKHWNAEQTAYRMSRDHAPIWALVYDPTPGGRKNDDGTTSYGLRFPALILAEYVAEQENVATEISVKLNAFDDMLEALEALVAANDGLRDEICNGPDVPGFDPMALGRAQAKVSEAEEVARAVIAAAKGGRS